MSYGLKYTLQFRDTLNANGTDYSNVWTVNIYENGYGGSSSSVIGTDKPIALNYKKQDLMSPLIGSELTINIQATASLQQYDEFLTAAPLQYYVDVLKNGTTWWSGVNTTDNFTRAFSNNPYSIALKFNCGLGELQWRLYENAGLLYTGSEQLIEIINNCLSFLPYNKTVREIINIREDNMDNTRGLLEQLYIADLVFNTVGDDGVTHGLQCNKLLNQLLTSLNCRIYQSNNTWYVERIYERINTSLTYFDYALPGTPTTNNSISYRATGTLNVAATVNNSSIPRLLKSTELAATQKYSALNYQFNSQSINSLELIPNAFFENKPTAMTSSGFPLRWDFQTTESDEKIELVDPYETDSKYQTAFSFGNTAQGLQDTYARSHGWWSSNEFYNYQSTYGMHAVQRTGDTWTRNWIYIDPQFGSLQMDFKFMIKLRFTCQHVSTNLSTDASNAANNTLCPFIAYFKIAVQDQSGNNFYMFGSGFNNGWQKNPAEPWYCGQIFNTPALFWYQPCLMGSNPLQVYSNSTLLTTTLSNLMKTANTVGQYFDVIFLTDCSATQGFNGTIAPFLTTPQPYKFDCWAYPPVFPVTPTTTGAWSTGNFSIAVQDYAINACDIQYKDSAASTVSYESFYSTPDLSNRWGEMTINTVYGDTLTPGYPGAFRLSSSTPTANWHNRGLNYLFDNGTGNADPGTGKFRFNNAAVASVTHIYIDNTDNQGNVQTANIAGFTSGQTISFRDNASGALAYFTVGTVVTDSGYLDIPVTYVSSSGTFSAGDSCNVDYQSKTLLVDLLFSKAVQLIGQYRHNLKAKIIGAQDFWQTYVATDSASRNYIQTGAQYDIKAGQIAVDMEEMSDNAMTITKLTTVPTIPLTTATGGGLVSSTPVTPIHITPSTPVVKTAAVTLTTTTTAYPI
jgi:hypothetical protein